ncbi:CAAX protease [Nodosilinea sp. LEGE 07088]|uniref:CAAX protease n=1 Tax=Nodosilinea sp. LEGE 07088 TaxID=2777968 RepID=UPI0018815F90|nr:CAAX protease [Nodosilinea sp. LEGE 07088]MBE9137144.1 CAAX protease [Nodosilinea sp. LEGE 07088]
MLDRFWEVLGYVFALNGEAFRIATTVPAGQGLAMLVVLLAGLSQGIGQGIVLFVNQVKPARFVFSLLINAVLFACGFLALVLSTWLVTLAPWSKSLPLGQLVTVLGLAYAPLLFSFLGAMPYLGVPILNLLSVWNLLAMVVGLGAIANLDISNAFGYVAFGWILLQVLQNTIGRPIASLGKRIANRAAGVDLVTSRSDLADSFQASLAQTPSRWKEEFTQSIDALNRGNVMAAMAGEPTAIAIAGAGGTVAAVSVGASPKAERLGSGLKTGLGLLAMVVLTLVVLVLLRPLREWWFGWLNGLPTLVRLVLNLVWISLVALVVAGLLAPLETLGWWAGWYDDDVNTTLNAGELAEPVADTNQISRYVVYLDGIGISSFEYLPDIEEFLDTLAPTLPEDVALIRGIMPYSVMNAPLDEDRPLAFLWRYADKLRFANPMSVLGLLVNIRNILIVGVSADKRYGPLYNQGIAQVVFNGLVKNGYQVGSGTPVTFIGYSGGGQMSCANAPYLKRALGAPIDVISLGGVISANINILKLEHLYHLVGEKDVVEKLGPKIFPGRWQLFPLSYWNRAKRRGKISFISMGPVGHQVPGGILDPKLILPDGRSSLQQTLDTINAILRGEMLETGLERGSQTNNYDAFSATPLVQYQSYPLDRQPDPSLYRPIGDWIGRLILPAKAERFGGAFYEIHHAPAEHWGLVGQVVKLCWSDHPFTQKLVQAVTHDVHFSADAEYASRFGGVINPVRLNHWLRVDPLESLAGSLPGDDMIVVVENPEVVLGTAGATLLIDAQPMEVTGRYYGLVQFVGPTVEDQWRVRHFNRVTRTFDGPEEIVSLPAPQEMGVYGSEPSTSQDLEESPYNESGWYVYGAQNVSGLFKVQSLGPRALFRLQPERVVFGGAKASYRYIRQGAWAEVVAQKGKVNSVLCTARDNGRPEAIAEAIDEWQVGDRALILHTYGGIGGHKKEPAAFSPIFFGHFAYGRAEVVHDPLADERRFEIRYYQVYAHNIDGLIAGTLHWSRYQGDRQRGWLGTRPTCDILVKLDLFNRAYHFKNEVRSPLTRMEAHLQAMTARYRIGDGTGGTFVGPSNNCSQDSNQALFASLQGMTHSLDRHADALKAWSEQHPDQANALRQLEAFGQDLISTLQPLGSSRPDWEKNEFNLGSSIEDEPIRNLIMGLGSWRTVLPRKASDVVVHKFLKYGASAWVLRTSQVGGHDPDIEPIAPMTF